MKNNENQNGSFRRSSESILSNIPKSILLRAVRHCLPLEMLDIRQNYRMLPFRKNLINHSFDLEALDRFLVFYIADNPYHPLALGAGPVE